MQVAQQLSRAPARLLACPRLELGLVEGADARPIGRDRPLPVLSQQRDDVGAALGRPGDPTPGVLGRGVAVEALGEVRAHLLGRRRLELGQLVGDVGQRRQRRRGQEVRDVADRRHQLEQLAVVEAAQALLAGAHPMPVDGEGRRVLAHAQALDRLP
jgi:hypothetical protein